MLERWDPGQQTVYTRFDDWKSGPLPALERVIVREVPEAATRRALIERGDADFSLSLPPKDAKELATSDNVKVTGVPIENSLASIGMNVTMPPFDNKLVRQAIAYAIPYEQLMDVAAYGRGLPMYGGPSAEPENIVWPQPFPYSTDLEKAKALLAEAGLPDGFETTLSLNLGLAQWQEPAALLIQENLAKIGVDVTIDKIPGANWRTMALVEKKLPFHFKDFGGWLNFPDYFFYWNYQDGHLFNSMNYRNEEIEALVDGTLHMPVDDPDYEPNVKRMLAIAFDEVPMVPLWQPFLDTAMQANIDSYEYWFHRQLDARKMTKG
jgi:peptide/nickel transport system substrate-binding protein